VQLAAPDALGTSEKSLKFAKLGRPKRQEKLAAPLENLLDFR
jgi:hypothetical protein